MKKILIGLSLFLVIAIGFYACKKTYEEGPSISFRSKMNRITGKWKLVSIEGVPRLHPEIDQFMELTDEEISDGVYKAKFINFQEEFGCIGDTVGEALFTDEGEWHFFSGAFGAGCSIGEELMENEGLITEILSSGQQFVGTRWKILRLTNKELKIQNNICVNDMCAYYRDPRTLTFKKQ